MRLIFTLIFTVFFSSSALFARTPIQKAKNIQYISDGKIAHQLDIYYPKDRSKAKDVMVFIHGGSWNSGKKETYNFFGKGFAKENVVTVIINYRLTPEVQFDKMAEDCAAAVAWIHQNITSYGGDSNRIFLSGHSAGGHLAALIATNREYFENLGIKMPVKGVLLIDAFGLDMDQYFREIDPSSSGVYYPTFTTDPINWQRGTPLNFTERSQVPFVGFVGERTYPGIKLGTKRFKEKLKQEGRDMELYTIPKKKHKGMIVQFLFRGNVMYEYCMKFMAEVGTPTEQPTVPSF